MTGGLIKACQTCRKELPRSKIVQAELCRFETKYLKTETVIHVREFCKKSFESALFIVGTAMGICLTKLPHAGAPFQASLGYDIPSHPIPSGRECGRPRHGKTRQQSHGCPQEMPGS